MSLRHFRSYLKGGLVCCFAISLLSLAVFFSSGQLKDGVIKLSAVKTFSVGFDTLHKREANQRNTADTPLVILYNRIPKTGSTTFANIGYYLASRNHFNVINVNITHNSHILSIKDQNGLCRNITAWTERQPAIFHGHFAFINLNRFGTLAKYSHMHPMYINIVREPIERLVSYFYFLRHGDDFRPGLRRRKAGRNDTFDQCVTNEGKDCEPRLLWKQIPFFCGQSIDCWEPGNPWALEQAKFNLVNYYLVVGVSEKMRQFVQLMEVILPRFYSGAIDVMDSGKMGGDHLRKTKLKVVPTNSTIEKFKRMAGQVWRMENDFYEFAKRHFMHSFNMVFGVKFSESSPAPLPSQYHFEKIRPKRVLTV